MSSYVREARGLRVPRELEALTEALEQMTASGCWWVAPWDFLMVCEPPCTLHRENAAPHRLDGSAIAFPDGWALYAIEGRQVPGWIIEEPGRITVQAIEDERGNPPRNDRALRLEPLHDRLRGPGGG